MTIRVLDEKSQLFLFTVVPGLFTSIFGFFMARALRPYNFMSLPFIFVYLKLNCPSVDDFDVKKELRQLLLQDDEENKGKPSNYFQQKWNRIQATIITAIATGTGYQMTIHVSMMVLRFERGSTVDMHGRGVACMPILSSFASLTFVSYYFAPFCSIDVMVKQI